MKLSEISNSLGNVNKNSLLDSVGIKTDLSQNQEKNQSFSNKRSSLSPALWLVVG